MKHLHAWAVGRPFLVAIVAHKVVCGMPVMHELHGLYQRSLLTKTAKLVPDTMTWLKLYQRRDAVLKELLATFWPEGERHAEGVIGFLARGALRANDVIERELAKANIRDLPLPHRLKLRAEIENALRYQYQEQLRTLSSELGGGTISDGIDLDAAFKKPELLFFMRVCLPCVLEYGKSPWAMYAEAQQGNRVAINQLLRMDKLILRDEQIAERAARLSLAGDVLGSELVEDAFKETPEFDAGIQGLNTLAAGLLLKSIEPLGYKLANEHVRSLFDAAARDRTGDQNAIELELAPSKEALKQALYRAKAFCIELCNGDTENIEPCHREMGLMAVVSLVDEPAQRPTWIDGRRTEQGA